MISSTLALPNLFRHIDFGSVGAPGFSTLVRWVMAWTLAAGLSVHADRPGPSSRRTSWVISEIHYHPLTRADGLDPEFIEIYNAGLIAEDLAGHRLEGEFAFTFPPGTVVRAGEFVVVSPKPADVMRAYGMTGVLGGGTNRLSNAGGTVRLRNPAGAVLLDVHYATRAPWPVAPDGAGPSLVLSRPSYGEADPRAWSASVEVGGSPGRAESPLADPAAGLVLNEILAHTDEPVRDFVELHNRSAAVVDLSGMELTDDPDRAGYVIPAGTTIAPGGWLALDQDPLGFALSATGETVVLYAPGRTRVVDAVHFDAQANGYSWGRSPEGGDVWHELIRPTPGARNAGIHQRPLIFSEIMYHALHGPDLEYVELHNRGVDAVDVSGWRLDGEIGFQFPAGTRLAPNAYLAVAKNLARLRVAHPTLTASNAMGDYQGSLSDRGGRIRLTMPEPLVSTNGTGGSTTNLVFVEVDAVTYADGGAWPTWADGGGSSLELRDLRAGGSHAANWAASDESAKAPWTTLEATGVLDQGVGSIDQLQLLSFGAGSYLVDDVEARVGAGANLVNNGTFDVGAQGWTMRGTLGASRWEAGEGAGAPGALRVDAVARGDTGANHVHTPLVGGWSPGATGTLRAKVRWLRGHPEFLLRVRGNYLEATGRLVVPENLGTPGAPNSRAETNVGPMIEDVRQTPVLPTAGQLVGVTARVEDPDGVARVSLRYRVDPASEWTTVTMRDDGLEGDGESGDGLYSASIPGQSGGRLVAYQVVAEDGAGLGLGGPASAAYPPAAGEALIRFGESRPAGGLGVYRLWMTQATFNAWAGRPKLDNAPLPVTFVYNDERVVHGVGALYAGSPHIAPGYTTPSGNLCGYVLNFPADEPFLGVQDVVLDWPGRDNTAQQEPMAYWIARELGLPFNHRRYVRLHVNGVTETTRGSVYEDAQQVNSDLVASWAPEASDGELFKIEQWFEFNDSLSASAVIAPRLENYLTTGGVKKVARYRWSWLPRAVGDGRSPNDFRRLFTLVDAANATDPGVYWNQLQALVDLEEWMRIFATENIVVNFDAWGYDIGKNMYAYKPAAGRWQLYMWDIDWVMLPSAQLGFSPTSPLMYLGAPAAGEGNRDPVVGRMYSHPGIQRAYWRAIADAVEGPLQPERVAARLDATHAALVANGVTRSAGSSLGNPNAVKTWLSQRRAYLEQQLDTVAAAFSITPTPAVISGTNLVTLRGTAPIRVREIRVNGVPLPLTWTSVTQWEGRWPLVAGVNRLEVEAWHAPEDGHPEAGQVLVLQCVAEPQSPEASLVLNEIQYHPAVSGAGFVELHNRSRDTAFDLSGWSVSGTGLTFPPGTFIAPQEFLVVAADRDAFAEAYGIEPLVAGVFPGRLSNTGETLALRRPVSASGDEAVVDQVTYDSRPPWPTAADGTGASLQLRDPSQDPRHPGNWWAAESLPSGGPQTLVAMSHSWRYDQSGRDLGTAWYAPDFDDGTWPEGGALLYNETAELPAAKTTPLTLGPLTFYFRTRFEFTGDPARVDLSLTTILDDGAAFYLNGEPLFRLGVPTEGPLTASTLAARNVADATLEGGFTVPATALRRGANVLAAEVHQIAATSSDLVFGAALEALPRAVKIATPGAANETGAPLPALANLWLNEFQPRNASGPTDRAGDRDPWVELFNAGDQALDLAGFFLTDEVLELARWRFPAGTRIGPRSWLVVWLDAEPDEAAPAEPHASFRAAAEGGQLVLSQDSASGPIVLDALTYPDLGPDRVLALIPDGDVESRTVYSSASPAGSNGTGGGAVRVFINEWMAANRSTLRDPADQNFEDWFELYNAGSTAVDLSGYSVSDDPANPGKSPLPVGTVIPARGFLLVWADEDQRQNQPGGEPHVAFRLSQNGEALVLTAPDGKVVDQVVFGAQVPDLSEGRWPDGGAVAGLPLRLATPRLANVGPTEVLASPELQALRGTEPGLIHLRWTTDSGGVYRVQFTTDLARGTWDDLTADLTATGATLEALDASGATLTETARFYRVIRSR